ncbi:MAG: PLP-dependent aminotransferase family protein [Paracoccaceae bacterium]|nr:PLP-dependent aminotransferase family protein [Paracoccaceae bacterium]
MPISEEVFFLKPDFEGTLQTEIRQMVASGILSGRFRPDEKLPSSRKLAQHLGISRLTVTLAYQELMADDYLTSKGKSGYFVSTNAPPAPEIPQKKSHDSVDWTRAIGQRFTGSRAVEKLADWEKFEFPFIYGQADRSLFDQQNWRLCALDALGKRDFTPMTTDYADRDDPQLVAFIARHTLPRRGILANADEILITAGAQNALWLTAQVLLTQRRTAAFEDPCYSGLRDILRQVRCHLAPTSLDKNGLVLSQLYKDTDVVFTTPSHQCPTNATMPLSRRTALLKRAREDDFLIVEDDYEFEMAFLQPALPALKSLDEDGRVVHVGSFSKSLFPGLRLGYLVGPAPFIAEARALRSTVLRHIPGHIQRTTAYFLSRGHYDALIRRIRLAFHERREVIDREIKVNGLEIAGSGDFGGSSLWMRCPKKKTVQEIADAARKVGVLIESGVPFFNGNEGENYYRLGYSSIPSSSIPEGIKRLASVIHD